ncbi:hypothetical protein ACIA6D_23720 [Streptomyces cacaoi]
MSPDNFITVGATLITGGFAAWGARSARRTKRQEKRDDFTVVTERMERELGRQGERIDELETDSVVKQEQITGQGAAISWLVVDRRGLVATIRGAGLKPPMPRPIPDRARPYLDHVEL